LLRLGKYQLEDRLGPQGAVETYRARIAERVTSAGGEDRLYAVKLLRADRVPGASYQGLARRFLAAGQRLLDAQGAGMARILEVGQQPMGVFVASDFVVGVDLARLLEAARAKVPAQRATLDPAVAGLVAGKLARVLAGAHTAPRPLHHLGLCPGNVVVTLTGEVVVLDFGLFASVRGLLEHGMDKWAFVAPELLGADIPDGRFPGGVAADLFALGGLLFYLLSGRPPVEARSLTDLSDRAWEPMPQLPGIPDRLNAAIRALTAPDPQDRPKDANWLSEWLADHAAAGDANQPIARQSARDELARDGAGNDTAFSASPPGQTPVSRPRPAVSRGAVAAVRNGRSARRGWLVALVAVVGLLLVAVLGLLAFRLARTFAAKRSAQGVAIAQRRSGETPAAEPQLKPPSRRRSPESWLPAVPTPLPATGSTGAADAASPRGSESDPIPVMPAGRFVVEESNTPTPERAPNHLLVDTQPHGAGVWIDGVWKGHTPLDLLAGPGGKRLVLVAAGYYMFRTSFEASDGAIIRLALVPVAGPVRGDAFLNVVCQTAARYPLLIDEVETGLLCPASRVPVPAGTHRVGIFVPAERKLFAVEITVPAGPKPVEVKLAR